MKVHRIKVYRNIVIVFAIILSISYGIFSFSSPLLRTAIKDPVTKEDYKYLEEKSVEVAKTLKTSKLNDENLKADFYFNNDELVVTVKSIKAKVTAKFPISNNLSRFEDGTIKTQGTVEFEKVKYQKERVQNPAGYHIMLDILSMMLIGPLVYILLFEIWFAYPPKKKE